MKKIFILLILITGTIFAAEPLVKDHAYIVSSINKSETIGAGESFSLVPQVVVATGSEKYVGSVSTFTGCYGGKRYEAGVEVGNCLVSVIDNLNSNSRIDALSAYQGKVLNEKIEKLEKDTDNTLKYGLYRGSKPYMYSIENVGFTEEATITLTNSEQLVFVFGSGHSTSCFATMLAGSQVQDYSFGKDELVSSEKNGNVIKLKWPSWFRGVMFSYLPFTIS